MKKRLLIIFIVVFLLVSLNFVISQEGTPNSPADKISGGIGSVNPKTGQIKKIEELEKSFGNLRTQNSSYLWQRWEKVAENNKFLSLIIKTHRDIQPILDPIFRYTVGVSYSVSWLFFLSLGVWILFLLYFEEFLSIFSLFSRGTSWAIAFLLAVILGAVMKIPLRIAGALLSIASSLTNPWAKWIVYIIYIIILVLLFLFRKPIKEYIKKVKENKGDEEEILNRARLKRATRNAEKFSEKVTDALGD